MSDITHSDYCPEDRGGELEGCSTCMNEIEQQHAYYAALFANRHHYTKEELIDAYSDPTQRAKRDSLLFSA